MHEMSIAMEICRIAEVQLGARVSKLVEVGVQVGARAGVEVTNLEFCLQTLLMQPPFMRAVPRFEHCGGDELRVSYLEVDDDSPPN